MNQKPRLIDYILLGLAVLCFLGMLIFVIVKYPSLPDTLPSHFNARGEIDGWSAKAAAAFFPPIVGFIMLVIIVPVSFFPKLWNNTQNLPAYKLPRVIRSTRTGIYMLLLVTEGFFLYTSLCITRLAPMPPLAAHAFQALLGLCIVYILVQTFRK